MNQFELPEHGRLQDRLDTAFEELRVAAEEIHAQQEEIADLLRQREERRSGHDRLLAVLPVAVLVTDRSGVVRRANASAAALAGRDPARLEGRPVFTFLPAEDRRVLRDLLTRLRPSTVERAATTFESRAEGPVPVEVSVSADDEHDTVSWLVLRAGTPGQHGEVPLADGLARLAALPGARGGRAELLRGAVAIAREVLGTHAHVSAQLGPARQPEVVATSDELAQAWDGTQLLHDEGPTFSAYADHVVAPFAASDPRWSRWGPSSASSDLGVVAVPLRVEVPVQGVMTVYLEDSRELGGPLVTTVETLALTLQGLLRELALLDEIDRSAADLGRALASRAVIDQAKGIVMAEKRCSADHAFQHLVDLSSTRHLKLREVAAAIVSGVAPPGH